MAEKNRKRPTPRVPRPPCEPEPPRPPPNPSPTRPWDKLPAPDSLKRLRLGKKR